MLIISKSMNGKSSRLNMVISKTFLNLTRFTFGRCIQFTDSDYIKKCNHLIKLDPIQL